MPEPEPVSIQVGGNVEGSIVVGDHNFVVNTNYGTIINSNSGPQVRRRQYAPQPPRAPREFVNRTTELARLEAWITAHDIVLIHAPDGMGKSALLKQAANSASARGMPDGVILLESVDVDGQALGAGDLIQNLFDALFESDPPLKVDAVSARTYLSNTRPLVLMDEVGLSPALQKILPDLFPQGAILLTADLAMGGDYERLPIGPLPRPEAINLLAAKADITLNEANRSQLDALCGLLNDVSLAVVISGQVMRETATSPETALQAVQGISPSSSDPVSTGLDRAFAFAFGRLTPDQQKLLSAAALTPGVSMSPEWLAAAAPGIDLEANLERLKAMGLLFANSPRLRLPPGLRDRARRAAALDEQDLLTRLIKFLTAPLQNGPLSREYVHDELGNLFGALTWAIRLRRWADVLTLGRALDPYLSLQGLWDGWGLALDYIQDAARQLGDQPALAWALHQGGVRAFGTGARQQALELLRQALELRRVLGDATGMAYTQHNLDVLLAAPAPANRASQQPKTPRPASRPNNYLLGGTVLAAIAAIAILATLFGLGIIHLPEVTPVPHIPPPTLTATPTPVITVTPVPTPLGGAAGMIFENEALDLVARSAPLLYTTGVDGSGLKRLLDLPARDPAYSPDGKRLAFVSNSQSDYTRIYIADADGSNAAPLPLHANLNASHPAWSPDGKWIAFSGSDPELGMDIYVVAAEGGDPTNLTRSLKGNADYPTWSPDGSQIAFQALPGANWQIYVMNADGSGARQLTSDVVDTKEGGSIEPAWAPDGKQIAFASDRAGNWRIYLMDDQGAQVQALTAGDASNALFPAWSPDSRWIAFSSNRDGNPQIYLMPVDGSQAILLAKLPGSSTEPDWWPEAP